MIEWVQNEEIQSVLKVTNQQADWSLQNSGWVYSDATQTR